MIKINMKVKYTSDNTRELDALFFNTYEKYGLEVYRNISDWIENKSLAAEILFRSFLQIHKQILLMPENQSLQLLWIINIGQSVCADYMMELYGERRCC